MTTSKTEDGGPAFPQAIAISSSGDVYGSNYFGEGMTLRDWFAGQWLAGIMAHPSAGDKAEELAECAYRQADAMLSARKGGGQS